MSKSQTVDRASLVDVVDPYIYAQLKKSYYTILEINPRQLLSSNRLDVVFRLAYLDYLQHSPHIAQELYLIDIQAQSGGSFSDPHNIHKRNANDFLDSFDSLFEAIKLDGFDSNQGLIPLSSNGTILNGAHRTACAIKLDLPVLCVLTELPPLELSSDFYYSRNVPSSVIKLIYSVYLKYSSTCFVSLLWPSSRNHHTQLLSLIKPIYSFKLKTNFDLALALTYYSYRHMTWLDDGSKQYPGLKAKIFECFPAFGTLVVAIFESSSLEQVLDLKKSLRGICHLGFSSVHITDTPQQACELADLVLHSSQLNHLSLRLSTLYSTSEKINYLSFFVPPTLSPFSYLNHDISLCMPDIDFQKVDNVLDICIRHVFDFDPPSSECHINRPNFISLLKTSEKSYQNNAFLLIGHLKQSIIYFLSVNLYWARRHLLSLLKYFHIYSFLKRVYRS